MHDERDVLVEAFFGAAELPESKESVEARAKHVDFEGDKNIGFGTGLEMFEEGFEAGAVVALPDALDGDLISLIAVFFNFGEFFGENMEMSVRTDVSKRLAKIFGIGSDTDGVGRMDLIFFRVRGDDEQVRIGVSHVVNDTLFWAKGERGIEDM
jgi:hypothetical protein